MVYFKPKKQKQHPVQTKPIPVIAVMDLNDVHRVLACRTYHEKKMAELSEDAPEYARHRQIWRECDRRLDQYDDQLRERPNYG